MTLFGAFQYLSGEYCYSLFSTLGSSQKGTVDRYTLHSKTEEFVRRLEKESGQIECICLRCFATVGRAKELSALVLHEWQHDCPAKFSVKSTQSAWVLRVAPPRAGPFLRPVERSAIRMTTKS